MDEELMIKKKPEISGANLARARQLADYTRKWMLALLWLAIPNAIANVLTNNIYLLRSDLLYIIGSVIRYICMILEICFFIKLRREEEEYFQCVKLAIGVLIAYSVAGVLYRSESLTVKFIALFAECISVVLFCIRTYHECNAHAMVIYRVDRDITKKWLCLWKWIVIGNAGVLVGSLLLVYQRVDRVLLSVRIGLVLSPVMLLVSAIAAVLRMVYLEKTANAMKDYVKYYTS